MSSTRLSNGFAIPSRPSFIRNDYESDPLGGVDERPPRQQIQNTETLYNEFAQKKKLRRLSSLTLPRSWSLWRSKSEDGDKVMVVPVENIQGPQEPPLGSSRTYDYELKVPQSKLNRRSSFRALMDKFRRYKSTESLEDRKRPPLVRGSSDLSGGATNGGKLVQYISESPSRLVVPVTGLQNHGNSCYVNAVLQCLNNTAQIYSFFITGQYRKDLVRRNRENSRKYGTNGELTEACGNLVQSLGRATYIPEISNSLLETVARFWPQFHDGGEQDAQEFLMWLLDRIHEDLNKRRRKKLKVKKAHRQDDLLAGLTEEAWGSSYISRLYRGLFRSSLTCKQCGQQSNTFDPFMCLSVPLPQVDMRPFYVNVVFYDFQSRITRFGFCTSVDCSVGDIKDLVAQKTPVLPEEMLVLEISSEGYQKTLSNEHGNDVLQDLDDLFLLELPKTRISDEEEHIFVILLHVSMDETKVYRRISAPRAIRVARETTYADLEASILANLDETGQNPLASKAPPFRIHLVERRDDHLDPQVDHPLYTELVDECLSFNHSAIGPRHLKLYIEWEPQYAEKVAELLIREKYIDDPSVQTVKTMPESVTKATLSDCLDLFMQEENVGMDETWECPTCGGRQTGITKRGTLWTLPDILVVHLKRFRQTSSTRFKLTTMVDFPLKNLDMSRYLTKDEDFDWGRKVPKHAERSRWKPWQKPRRLPDNELHRIHSYSLFGVVNHHGRLNSGHYTAFCRHPADGAWYLYDDLKVKTVEDPGEIQTKDAYLLFYQREPLQANPSLYYNDFSGNAGAYSMYELRGNNAPSRIAKSSDELVNMLPNGNDAELVKKNPSLARDNLRGTHPYASLPPKPPIPHLTVHRPSTGTYKRTPAIHVDSLSNGYTDSDVDYSLDPSPVPPARSKSRSSGGEVYYQRQATTPVIHRNKPVLRDVVNQRNGVENGCSDREEEERKGWTLRQRPIHESCV